MKLTAIRLRAFRMFRQGVDVTGLDSGLNIIHGPNESGKSTLAHAIRAGFLERHSAGTHHDLLPWGDSAASPEVQIDFEYDGRRHQLIKQFMRTRRCDLRIGDQTLSGDEAEQYLAELMGFTVPARGSSRAEHRGVPGLLWIEQGEGHHLQEPVEYAHDQLQGVLGDALGHVASSDGDRVLQVVTQRLEQLRTRTGNPRNEYRKAIEQQEQLQEELRELDDRVQQYRDQVDELARLEAQFVRDAAEQPWREMRQKEALAREGLAQAQAMRGELKQHQAALEACVQAMTMLHQRLETFRQYGENVIAREKELQQKQEAMQALSDHAAGLQQAVDDASQAHERAREALAVARQAQWYQDKKKQLAQVQDEIRRLDAQREQAQAVVRELEHDQKRASALRVDLRELEHLQTLREQLQSLEIRQETIATRLQFNIVDGQAVELADTRITGQTERLLLDSTTLKIPGVGSVRITPGGEDAAALAREQTRVRQELQAGLLRLQVQTVEQLQQRASEHAVLEARIREHQSVLAVQAPEGLEALERRRAALVGQAEALHRDCEALASSSEAAMPDIVHAQQAEQDAERVLKQAEVRLQKHHVDTASARAALDAAHRELELAKALANNPDKENSERQAQLQLVEERANKTALEQKISVLQSRIDAVRPDILEQDVVRYRHSADQMQEAHAECERTIREIKGRLQAWGAQGLEEQRYAVQGKLAAITRRVDEFTRNVRALSLLHDLLRDKRQELTRQLHEPLRKRLMHYLDVLFGSADGALDVVLGDGLLPVGLQRQDTRAGLDALSFGAREQMGLITRLAYADLLKEAGQPTLIMLDDALVHSDATRLSHMKRILYDAAGRHQILLFTCHPEKWRDMGVTPRAIRDF